MRTHGRPTTVTSVLIFAAATAFATAANAQESQAQAPAQPATSAPAKPALTPEQEALAQDFYRAEFVILERKVDPADVAERMSSRLPEPPNLDLEEVLRATSESGDTRTTLKLVPQQELHLNAAAKRLANSGRYRVLLAEGWYQAFPPDFEGKPLWVTIGDWLPDAEHTDVQGQITIDRQRYLHVDVQLNHWRPKTAADNVLGIDLNSETPSRPRPARLPIEPAQNKAMTDRDALSGTDSQPANVAIEPAYDEGDNAENEAASEQSAGVERELVRGINWPRAELITWIQETRRMRSEEVHFLDSPTLGVLIFFKKIEPEDAGPMILKLGITGDSEPQEAS